MNNHNNNKLIPLSILVAVTIVSFSFLYSRDFSLNIFKNNQAESDKVTHIPPVNPDEPILGNPEAPILFVEYSDTESPFSSKFAEEREILISIFAETGQIAWVYRPLPLINDASFKKALALECVAEENKDYNFWNYLLEIQDKNILKNESGEINTDLLLEPLEKRDLLTVNIVNCINEERYKDKITKNIKDAVDSGAERTPFTVILLSKEITKSQKEKIMNEVINLPKEILTVTDDAKRILMNGKVPIENIKSIVEILIST